jgi:hypothetical protein
MVENKYYFSAARASSLRATGKGNPERLPSQYKSNPSLLPPAKLGRTWIRDYTSLRSHRLIPFQKECFFIIDCEQGDIYRAISRVHPAILHISSRLQVISTHLYILSNAHFNGGHHVGYSGMSLIKLLLAGNTIRRIRSRRFQEILKFHKYLQEEFNQ